MRGYMQEFDLDLCGQMGTVAATLCLAQSGSQNHRFTLESFKEYFRSYFNENGKLELLNK